MLYPAPPCCQLLQLISSVYPASFIHPATPLPESDLLLQSLNQPTHYSLLLHVFPLGLHLVPNISIYPWKKKKSARIVLTETI